MFGGYKLILNENISSGDDNELKMEDRSLSDDFEDEDGATVDKSDAHDVIDNR
jgi:hypothetical protein